MSDKFARKLPLCRILSIAAIAAAVIVCSIQQISRRDGDPELFINIANLLRQGKDIYGVASDHGNFYYYPPFFAVLVIPLILLPFQLLIFLWAAVSVALLGWSIAAFYSGLDGRPFLAVPAGTRWVVCFVTILFSFRFIISHLRYGQTNIFVLALVVLGLTWVGSPRKIRAGFAVALSAAVKFTTIPFGFWFLVRREGKVLTGIIAGAFFAILLPAIVVGLERNIDYHAQWLDQVALRYTPGTGNWVGTGNVSLRAQAERFFSNAEAFQYKGEPQRVTIIELSSLFIRAAGYALMFGIILAICFYAVRFRNAHELISKWGGFAFVFSLLPNFTPVSEIPHLVLLIPAHIYVVHLLLIRRFTDPLFRILVMLSFVSINFSTKLFVGQYLSQWLTAVGCIGFGVLFLSAAIMRAGFCIENADENTGIPKHVLLAAS